MLEIYEYDRDCYAIGTDSYVIEIGSVDTPDCCIHLVWHSRVDILVSYCEHTRKCALFRPIGLFGLCRLGYPPSYLKVFDSRLQVFPPLMSLRYPYYVMITFVGKAIYSFGIKNGDVPAGRFLFLPRVVLAWWRRLFSPQCSILRSVCW